MSRIIDTHGHYVFCVNDGAESLDESWEMVRAAYEQGARHIFCTSHDSASMLRYRRNLKIFHIITEQNLAVQVNAYSLAETENVGVRDFARRLLQEKLVTFIGSDTHGTGHRPVSLASGVRYIHETCDAEYAADV